MTGYRTVEQSLRANGERHLANAVSYASRGLLAHSEGSLRKANRNFKRAVCFMVCDGLVRMYMDDLARKVAANVMGAV
jgi:hypothetical protein